MQMKYILCSLLLFFHLCGVAIGEKRFYTKIVFPASIQLDEINIQYHNGFQLVPFKILSQNHTIVISDLYYTKYVELIINYNGKGILHPSNSYFLERISKIEYIINSNGNVDSVKLLGAYNIKDMGEGKFDLFVNKEMENLDNFIAINGQNLDDSILFRKYVELDAAVQGKKLEFIQNNSGLYYSLWMFREQFVSNTNYTIDSLYAVYKKCFSKKYSKTFEAKQIISVLNGRSNCFVGKPAPLFSAKDINGNSVKLSEYKGKNYVILNFWASWCKPCVAEMPILDSINNLFISKDIIIISESQDRDKEKCLNAIVKYHMNWINIINDPFVYSAYGNNPGLPQVYLVDLEGKIIYSRSEEKDYDLKKLFSMVKEL
jgi:thiol-disulfide isomerase/thioredoxin